MPTCKAVIISAFGSGNLPIKEESGVLQALEATVRREILVVVVSSCKQFCFYKEVVLTLRLRLPTVIRSSISISTYRPHPKHLPAVRAWREALEHWRATRL